MSYPKIEDDLYIKILTKLSKNGVGCETDISSTFNRSYLTYTADDVYWGMRINYIKKYLDNVVENNHIIYTIKELENTSNKKVWINPLEIKGEITVTGESYLQDVLVKRGNLYHLKFTRWVAILSLILSVIAIVISILKTTNIINKS